MSTAMDALHAARALWDAQNDQLSFEVSAPVGDYGTPTPYSQPSQVRGVNPGPETSSVGGTIGASPPSRRVSDPFRMRPPAGTTPSNPTADGCSPSRASAAVGVRR